MTTTFLRRLDFTVTTRHEKVKPKNNGNQTFDIINYYNSNIYSLAKLYDGDVHAIIIIIKNLFIIIFVVVVVCSSYFILFDESVGDDGRIRMMLCSTTCHRVILAVASSERQWVTLREPSLE